MEDKTAIVYLMQQKSMANKRVDALCKVKGCGENIEMSIKHVGSAVHVSEMSMNNAI
jgi:hypothetical protein